MSPAQLRGTTMDWARGQLSQVHLDMVDGKPTAELVEELMGRR